jgi:hypothetical protein
MKMKISVLKLGIATATGIAMAISVTAASVKPSFIKPLDYTNMHDECVPEYSSGGASCRTESNGDCSDEGLECQWTVTYYACKAFPFAGIDQCHHDEDCSGGGTTDTAWCYTSDDDVCNCSAD